MPAVQRGHTPGEGRAAPPTRAVTSPPPRAAPLPVFLQQQCQPGRRAESEALPRRAIGWLRAHFFQNCVHLVRCEGCVHVEVHEIPFLFLCFYGDFTIFIVVLSACPCFILSSKPLLKSVRLALSSCDSRPCFASAAPRLPVFPLSFRVCVPGPLGSSSGSRLLSPLSRGLGSGSTFPCKHVTHGPRGPTPFPQ